MASLDGTRRFYEFGPFRLDAAVPLLLRGRAVVPLGPKAVEILLLLVERRGNPVTKDELLRAIWPETFVEESNLTYNVSVLRKALGEGPGSKVYIETIPKRGYRFVAAVTVQEELGQTGETPRAAPVARPWMRAVFFAIGGAALLSGLLYFAATTTNRGEIRSVAILPFLNLTPDSAEEYFSDGLTEDLTTALSKMKELKVPARTSAFQFKGKTEDIRTIGKKLNVSAVLEGSVRKQNGRLRISAQLSRVSDGYHLWSETYDRESRDIFAVQDEICRSVVTALRVHLAQAPGRSSLQRYAGDPEVYALYLQGRYFSNRRTRESIGKGIGYFEQALAKDGSYAPAHAGVADSYALLGMFGMVPPADAFPRARAAAKKALELDDRLAEAHTSLGAVEGWFDWDARASESAFRHAIELDPAYVLAHQWYAEYLSCLGRHLEARAEIQRALDLDPLSPTVNSVKALTLYLARQYDQVIEQSRATAEIDAEHSFAPHFLALAFEQKGMYREAVAHFETSGSWSDLGHVYAETGRRTEALAILDQALARSRSGEYVPPYSVAEVYAGLRDKGQALAWLERARSERSTWIPYLNVDPRFDILRGEARFLALVKDAGLAR